MTVNFGHYSGLFGARYGLSLDIYWRLAEGYYSLIQMATVKLANLDKGSNSRYGEYKSALT